MSLAITWNKENLQYFHCRATTIVGAIKIIDYNATSNKNANSPNEINENNNLQDLCFK